MTITTGRPGGEALSAPVPGEAPAPSLALVPAAPRPLRVTRVVTPGRANRTGRRWVENREFAGFVRRILRALRRRVEHADPAALAELVKLRGEVEDEITRAVLSLIDQGYSWAEIGEALGMERQHAWRKWHR